MLRRKIGGLLGITVVMAHGVFAMNVTHLSNIFIEPEFHFDKCFQLAVMAERGTGIKAFNSDGCVANALRIWDAEQNALKMLQGFPFSSAIGKLNTRINADDDGVRGHFVVDGCLELSYNVAAAFRYQIMKDFLMSVFVPFYGMQLKDVSWCNRTLNVTQQDARVRDYLTDDFFDHVQELGCLNLRGWKRSGFGDTIILLEWIRDFPQQKPLLKNVNLNARFGLSVPTGLKQDEDRIFAVAFGNDGAYGIPFGLGLELTVKNCIRVGLDVELLHLFGNSKVRRIKTDEDQTELLLLQKVCAYKDWGLTQQFTLYGQLNEFFKGFSLKVGYQYVKHGEDRLALETFAFSNEIANTATSLLDWTSHSGLIKLVYDHAYDNPCARVKPQYALFTKIPFNGTRSALFTTVGAYFAIDF